MDEPWRQLTSIRFARGVLAVEVPGEAAYYATQGAERGDIRLVYIEGEARRVLSGLRELPMLAASFGIDFQREVAADPEGFAQLFTRFEWRGLLTRRGWLDLEVASAFDVCLEEHLPRVEGETLRVLLYNPTFEELTPDLVEGAWNLLTLEFSGRLIPRRIS